MSKIRTWSRSSVSFLAVTIALCAVTHGQGQGVAPETITSLKSADWIERARGVRTVAGLAGSGVSDAVLGELLGTLERELRIVEDSFRRGIGVSNELGEEYGDYLAELQSLIRKNGDLTDNRVLRMVAFGVYNPDSPFVAELVNRAGDGLTPLALEMADSDLAGRRWNGLALLGRLYEQREALGISAAAVTQIRGTLYRAAQDDAPPTRSWAVIAIGAGRSRQDAAFLRQIAESDPAFREHEAKGTVSPVREAALEALEAIDRSGR